MVNVKKCLRCGCMIVSENVVCDECEKKDNRDANKLKVFLNENVDINSKKELSIATGIVDKNLDRILDNGNFNFDIKC